MTCIVFVYPITLYAGWAVCAIYSLREDNCDL